MKVENGSKITIKSQNKIKTGIVIYSYFDGEFWDIETDNFYWKQCFDGGEIEPALNCLNGK